MCKQACLLGEAGRECARNQFRCNDGQCIPARFECDEIVDCEDRSDEHSDCPVEPGQLCGPNDLICADGKMTAEIRRDNAERWST